LIPTYFSIKLIFLMYRFLLNIVDAIQFGNYLIRDWTYFWKTFPHFGILEELFENFWKQHENAYFQFSTFQTITNYFPDYFILPINSSVILKHYINYFLRFLLFLYLKCLQKKFFNDIYKSKQRVIISWDEIEFPFHWWYEIGLSMNCCLIFW
jgi:hypothetical protein